MSEPTEAATEQAAGQTAEFKGETFRLNPDVSEWAVLEFAAAADGGQDASEFRGLASLYAFVMELVHPDDRERFRALCKRERVGAEALFEFMFGAKLEDLAERPTGRSSDSSDGPNSIEPTSVVNFDGSTSQPTGLLSLVRNRPDLAPFLDAATPKAS